MRLAAAKSPMTATELLAGDESETVRHEFVRGEVFAVAGADEWHITVTMNVATALCAHLRCSPCRTLMADMKLRVDAADCFFYPDVLVTCSALDAADPLIKREPVLVAEVLSPSTAAYDRGGRFAAYRQLPTLRELLFIDPRRRRCDLHRLGADGLWVLYPFDPGAAVVLESVGTTLPPEVLWDEVAETGPAGTGAAPTAGEGVAP